MPNDVKIVVTAVDKASSELKKINGEIGKAESGFQRWKGAITTVVVITGVAATAAIAIKGLADHTLNYANQVRKLNTTIGATPEEASKLIQVADDMGIEFGQLEIALKGAIRKGYQPTVAELGRMSDAYLKLQPGVERTKFLLDTFGRSGADLARIMELGSEQIEGMGDSIEGTARLMDQEALDAAEEYRIALDNLGDAKEDLSLTIGRKLIPALTTTLGLFNDLITGSSTYAEKLRKTVDMETYSWLALREGYQIVTIEIDRNIRETGFLSNAIIERLTPAIQITSFNTEEWAAKMRLAGQEGGALRGPMENAAAATWAFHEATEAAGRSAGQAARNIQDMIDQSNRDIGTAIEDAIKDLEWFLAGGGEITDTFAAVQQAVRDKKISPADAQKYYEALYIETQNLQLDLNEVNADEAGENISRTLGIPLENAKGTVEWLLNQSGKTIDLKAIVTMVTVGAPYRPTGRRPIGVTPRTAEEYQHGTGGWRMVPPGYPSDSFMIGLSSGEKYSVTPSGKSTPSGNIIVFEGDIIINSPAAADRFWQRADRLARISGAAGYAGRT